MTWLVILSWCSRMHIRRSRWELPCSYRCWQRFQSTFWLKYGSSVYKKGKNQEVIYVWTYECHICIFLHLNDILVLSLGRICRGKKKKAKRKPTTVTTMKTLKLPQNLICWRSFVTIFISYSMTVNLPLFYTHEVVGFYK